MMNLLEMVQKDKLALIAMYTLVSDCASGLGLDLAGTISAICAEAGVNRTQVYEKGRHIRKALEKVALSGPGRPRQTLGFEADGGQGCALLEKVLRYRLAHPGAQVAHASGRVTYSDGFRRFILDLADRWEGGTEDFCRHVEIPYPTLAVWQQTDRREPYQDRRTSRSAVIPAGASETCRTIVEEYQRWEGSLRDFFRYACARFKLPANQIRRVLVICRLLPLKGRKGPRYRGSTERVQPGDILVTDGKGVDVVSTWTGEISKYNWQAMVDQTTACHTATVVTRTETAQGVLAAFEASVAFMGKAPRALVHDQKPIHQDARLRSGVEKTTVMIEATAGRGENKAVVEGEFGKFVQQVGEIYLDDSTPERLMQTAVGEVLRAYTAGVNHAGRAEFDGKSRVEMLREACPASERDLAFIEGLRAAHNDPRPAQALPTAAVARALMDEGFARLGMEPLDPAGKLRHWLSRRFEPAAIRQALAIVGVKRARGELQGKEAHRYLVKVIRNCQDELDLRAQEDLLRLGAVREQQAWLQEFDREYQQLQDQDPRERALGISESALFGSLFLQRSFWEDKLKELLLARNDLIETVCNHVRRLWDAPWNDRFQLIDKIISWQYQIAAVGSRS